MENKNINLTVMRTMEEILDSIFNKYGDKLSGDKLAELASQEFNTTAQMKIYLLKILIIILIQLMRILMKKLQ